MRYLKHIVIFIGITVSFQACISTQEYERPNDIESELLYRTDQLPVDSTSMADFSWKEIFTDELLQQHISEALSNNIDIRKALESIEIGQSYLKQAKMSFLPTVEAGPGISYTTSSLNTQFGAIFGERQHNVQYDLTLQAGWEADIWGKLKSNKRAVAASYMQTIEGHKAVKSQIVSAVASAYTTLLALDQQKASVQQTIDFRKEYLEVTGALKEAGTVTEVAVKQAEAQLLNAESLIIELDYSIVVQENYLSILMGKTPQAIDRSDFDEMEILHADAIGYPASIISNRPDVKAAEYDLVRTLELSNVATANFYPSLRLTANTGLQSIELSDFFSVNSLFANIAAGLTQPIFSQRRLKTEKEVSLSNQEIAYLNFKQASLSAIQEVSNAIAANEAQARININKEKEAEAYQKATEYSQELVNYGLANYLEVITSGERALSAELDYINSKAAMINAQIQLYKALGGGWK